MSRISEKALPVVFAAMVSLVILLLMASPAVAGEDLMAELPSGQDTVIVVDFDELRDSPLYDQAFELLNGQPAVQNSLRQLENELGLNAKTDLDSLVVTSNSPPLSTGLLNHPAGALQQAAAQESDGGLVLIRGDFEPKALLARLADESESSTEDEQEARSSLRQDGFELRVIDDRTLAIILGPTEFLDETREKLKADRSGPGQVFEDTMKRLGESQGLYMMIEPSIEDPERMQRQMGALASFGAISLDLKDNVGVAGFLRLDDAESAARLAGQVDEMRQEVAGNPLASLLGFAPVLRNLSVQQDEEELLLRTSMSNNQAIRLVRQGATLMNRGQQLQRPLEGRGIGDDPQPRDEAEQEDSQDLPEPSTDGVEADFN